MIEICKLYKKFEEKELFSNYNLTIEDGEFVIFYGESGCGKTTLLNMIGSLEPIDAGEILVNQKDISIRKNQLDYLKNEVGFLFQNFALIEGKTVRENLEIVSKKSRSDISIEQALEKVGLVDKIDTKVYKLSGGEQQRIALARLMVKKCSVVLADEPTGSLDSKNAQKVIDLLMQLKEMGKTIIMVTHNEEYRTIGTQSIDISNKEWNKTAVT